MKTGMKIQILLALIVMYTEYEKQEKLTSIFALPAQTAAVGRIALYSTLDMKIFQLLLFLFSFWRHLISSLLIHCTF